MWGTIARAYSAVAVGLVERAARQRTRVARRSCAARNCQLGMDSGRIDYSRSLSDRFGMLQVEDATQGTSVQHCLVAGVFATAPEVVVDN